MLILLVLGQAVLVQQAVERLSVPQHLSVQPEQQPILPGQLVDPVVLSRAQAHVLQFLAIAIQRAVILLHADASF